MSRQERRKGRPATIYLARCQQRRVLKIGVSVNVRNRIRDIAATTKANWEVLDTFPGTFEVEQLIHSDLIDFRSHYPLPAGREWYLDHPVVVICFERFKEGLQ